MLRRLLSSLLLALICFPLISPAVLAVNVSSLPACCRKGGKHHCAVHETAPSGVPAGAQISDSATCAFFPAAAFSGTQFFSGSPAPVSLYSISFFTHPAGSPQTAARCRASLARGWQKRGPPSLLS